MSAGTDSRVTSRIRVAQATDPLGRDPDPWHDFRTVELLNLTWSQEYRHSLGKYSRFFVELEQGRLFATRCPACGQIWLPPRPLCPADHMITGWVELSGRGRLVTWSVLHSGSQFASHLRPPYIFAYVALDGATTLFGHILRGVDDPSRLAYGLPVRVVYEAGPVAHPLHLMAFELDPAAA
jgi:uncharacterized OB-fold protein